MPRQGRSPLANGVLASRHRLGKKLGLPKNMDLDVLFVGFILFKRLAWIEAAMDEEAKDLVHALPDRLFVHFKEKMAKLLFETIRFLEAEM